MKIILIFILSIFIIPATFAEKKHNFVLQNGVCLDNDSPVIRYKSGWDVKNNKRSRYKTRSGREKIKHTSGKTDIYATLMNGYTTPHLMIAKKGDTINIHLTSLIREKAPQEFSIEKFGINELLSPGETKTISFKANKEEILKFYSRKHCTDVETSQEGYIVIGGNDSSIEHLKQQVKSYTKSDYNQQISYNRKNNNQNTIGSWIGKITKHRVKLHI